MTATHFHRAEEKFSKASAALRPSRGRGPQECLRAALVHLVGLSVESGMCLPADLRDEFNRLLAAVTRVAGSGGVGGFDATIAVMLAGEAEEWAAVIRSLQRRVARANA